jgi:hypothetical protein
MSDGTGEAAAGLICKGAGEDGGGDEGRRVATVGRIQRRKAGTAMRVRWREGRMMREFLRHRRQVKTRERWRVWG